MTAPTSFVTGGSGSTGGRLIEALVAGGHEVRALARSEGMGELRAGRAYPTA
jgi:uncharacterized protein YbjT (DUF2867 family)